MTENRSASPAPPSALAASTRPRQPRLVLAGFVLLVFSTGTAEYLVAGLLPRLATDMDVSVATAGQAVTAYAIGVAVGGPIITVLTARLPRKGLALALATLFIVGTIATILAPSFEWLVLARVLSACAQATLFAIGLTTAITAMGPARSGQAIAIVTSGLTVATVLGVPAGALLGGSGWRTPFTVIAVVAIAGTALLATNMPRTPAPSTGMREEIDTLLRVPVLLAVSTTVIGFAGVGVAFTYLVPLLTTVTGIPAGAAPALLLAYGAGGFAGNLFAGRLADRNLSKTVTGVFLALIVVLALFPVAAPVPVAAVVLVLGLGLLSTATIAPLQTLVLRHVAAAPTLSVAVNVGAFNLANAIGAGLGGTIVAAGLLRWNGLAAAAFACLGLLLTSLALRAPVSASDQPAAGTDEAQERAG